MLMEECSISFTSYCYVSPPYTWVDSLPIERSSCQGPRTKSLYHSSRVILWLVSWHKAAMSTPLILWCTLPLLSLFAMDSRPPFLTFHSPLQEKKKPSPSAFFSYKHYPPLPKVPLHSANTVIYKQACHHCPLHSIHFQSCTYILYLSFHFPRISIHRNIKQPWWHHYLNLLLLLVCLVVC